MDRIRVCGAIFGSAAGPLGFREKVRDGLFQHLIPSDCIMRIIAVMNQKGGVGKTTCTINIGAGLSLLSRKVLLVDLDPQAHLTYSLGISAHEQDRTLYEVFKGELKAGDCLQRRGGMDIIPSSLDLSGADIEFSGFPGCEYLLRQALEGLPEYDFILIDCPPNLGILTINAMAAGNEIFVPLQSEFLALQSMGKLYETVDLVRRRLNRDLDVTGIVVTRFSRQKKLNREVVKKINEYFGDKVFETPIRENVALAEAPGFGKDIFSYRPGSSGAQDYHQLCKEILKRG